MIFVFPTIYQIARIVFIQTLDLLLTHCGLLAPPSGDIEIRRWMNKLLSNKYFC
jgi:hypothetical protein